MKLSLRIWVIIIIINDYYLLIEIIPQDVGTAEEKKSLNMTELKEIRAGQLEKDTSKEKKKVREGGEKVRRSGPVSWRRTRPRRRRR